MPISLCLDVLLIVLVVLAAANDLLTRRIPNRLLLSGAVSALALHGFSHAPTTALMDALAGALTGLVIFLPLYCLRGMAAGDVKLMATVGLFHSPTEMLHLGLMTVLAGGLMALVIVLCGGRLRSATANVYSLLRPIWMRMAGMQCAPESMPEPSVGSMPYGLAIACATLLLLAQRHS